MNRLLQMLLSLLLILQVNHVSAGDRRLVSSWFRNTQHYQYPWSNHTSTTNSSASYDTRTDQKTSHYSLYGWSLIGPFLSLTVILWLLRRKCNESKRNQKKQKIAVVHGQFHAKRPKDIELVYVSMDDDTSQVTVSTIGLESINSPADQAPYTSFFVNDVP